MKLINHILAYPFDYSCLENLRELIFKSESNIVVTSSWRKSQTGMKILSKKLSMYGLDKFVIGITPDLGLSRGEEIKEYLINIGYNNDINFVILDDDNDVGDLSQNLVQTNIMTGLTHENIEQALNILKSKRKILKI